MKVEKLRILVGVSALLLLFTFNVRHALNDYGVSDPNSTLHPEVLAQTNTSGDGGDSSGGGNSGGGNIVDCFSSGTYSPGCEYWNCGFCCFRRNRAGTGSQRECRANSGADCG